MTLVTAFARRAPRGIANMMSQRSTAVKSDIFRCVSPMPSSNAVSTMGGVRHGGASAIACGAAVIALGGVAQGTGTVFAAMVVGLARNPAIKDDLFAYTMIGFGMVEMNLFAVLGFAGMLLFSE